MRRERTLKIVLVLVGLLFSAGIYLLVMFVRQDPALAMMLSLYVTLGIFLRRDFNVVQLRPLVSDFSDLVP
jgi:hypothetical protein